MGEGLKPPAHFAASIGWSGRETLPDDHGAWRLIGAWIATRQRGEAELIRPLAADGEADRVVADAAMLVGDGGGPLQTGDELEVEATARSRADGATIRDIDITISGTIAGQDGGEKRRLHLAIAEAVLEGNDWKIKHLLDAGARALLANPDFRKFMEQQRPDRP